LRTHSGGIYQLPSARFPFPETAAMPRQFRSMLALVLSMILGFPLAARAADVDPAALDQTVLAAVKAFEVPGAAVAIVKDDKIVYLKGFGFRAQGAKEPVTPDTVFAIASCSKAFTATAVAMMVADHKMNWDDPVRKHLDFFRLSDPSADGEVTV